MVIIGLAAILIRISLYSYAFSPYAQPYHWWFGVPFFGWFFLIPLFFLVFFAFRWFFWWPYGCGWYGRRYDSAMDTLRERFARGELTREQFEQMRKDLKTA